MDWRRVIKGLSLAVLPFLVFAYPDAAAGQVDPYPVTMQRMKARFEALTDYSCSYNALVSDGRRTQKWTYRYFFKKPDLIRMEIVTGENAGVILIVRDGKVRVKPSGLLSILSLTLRPDDRRIIDVRKNRPDQTSWGYFLDQHLRNQDLTTEISASQDILDGRPVLVYEITSQDPARTQGIAREKIWVAVPEDLLLRYEMYDRDGRLAMMSHFKEIVLDSGLPDSLFKDFKRKFP
jgi:outer membrane lipoprotein-sorting protein